MVMISIQLNKESKCLQRWKREAWIDLQLADDDLQRDGQFYVQEIQKASSYPVLFSFQWDFKSYFMEQIDKTVWFPWYTV